MIFLFLFLFSSVPNWKDVSSNNTNMGINQLSLTIKNNIDSINTKPMTYSCLSTTVSFVKHDLKESVEVYKGRNLHPPPRSPPLTVTDRVKCQRSYKPSQTVTDIFN